MRGMPRTCASSNSAESRGASIPLRVKKAVVHSKVFRTVHGPSGCAIVWAILKDGREGREGRGRKIEDGGWEESGGFVLRRRRRSRRGNWDILGHFGTLRWGRLVIWQRCDRGGEGERQVAR